MSSMSIQKSTVTSPLQAPPERGIYRGRRLRWTSFGGPTAADYRHRYLRGSTFDLEVVG